MHLGEQNAGAGDHVERVAEQVQVLRGCVELPRARVAGGAGTGKTAIALEAAKRFAREPDRVVLLICFNKMLCAHLAATVGSWGPIGGRVDVTTFHSLCRRAFDALGLVYAPPPDTDQERSKQFWDKDAPEALLEALAADAIDRYDAIIVDEAQDFHADWLRVLEDTLKDQKDGRIAYFFDPAQKIFDRPTGLTASPPTYTLTTNFRNAKAIAGVVSELGRVEMEPHPRAPDGEPPRVHSLGDPVKAKAQLDDLVKKLVLADVAPDQITILTPHRRENSSLKGVTEIGGVALAESPDARDGKVLHTTIGAFKGLESDVIILVDVDPDDARCDRRARYVAASRAKLALHVFARGDWLAA
jgi:superfamily I DNA/RNA helicase